MTEECLREQGGGSGGGAESAVNTEGGVAGEEADAEGITMGFADISTLRESLESDTVIKKSIVSTYCSFPESESREI